MMRRLREDAVSAYVVSVIAVGAAFFAGTAFSRPIMAEVPFVTFYPAILISALAGGIGPGIFAIAASSLIAWYWFLPVEWPVTTQVVAVSIFVLVNGLNITLVLALHVALARLLAREHEVRTLMETAHQGIIVVDQTGIIRLVNAEKLFGYPRHELVGESVEVLIPQRLTVEHKRLCGTFMDAPETRAMGAGLEVNARRKNGTEFPVEIALNGFDQDSGKVVLATVLDISERKKAAEHQQLLIRELNHRTQNLFAVVQSIVRRSLPGESGPKHDLLNRLQVLSRAHSMLANSAYDGAQLHELLQSELSAFTDRASVSRVRS
jgi:PAS domain S-box-containing protein